MTQDIHSFASVGNLYQKCISLVRIRLQTRKTAPKASHRCKKASTKFRKTLESKIAPIRFDGLGQEKSLEISVFLPCGETQGGFLVYPVAMMGGAFISGLSGRNAGLVTKPMYYSLTVYLRRSYICRICSQIIHLRFAIIRKGRCSILLCFANQKLSQTEIRDSFSVLLLLFF